MNSPQTHVPESVIQIWPTIPPGAWEQLSEHRWRAPHSFVDGAVVLVVTIFGQTIGQGLGANHSGQRVQETYARLIESAARLAAHRVACEDGTPVINDDGRCHWCGMWPSDHRHPRSRATSG